MTSPHSGGEEQSEIAPVLPRDRIAGRLGRRIAGMLAGLIAAAGLAASPGATAAEVIVDQVAPFSGPLMPYSSQIALGARLVFDAVNAHGGVNGVTIRFKTYDDRLDAKRTVELYKLAAQQDQPVAFLYPVGPIAIGELFKQAIPQQLGVPVIGTIPSMHKLRKPINPYVFHVGMGDDAELAQIVQHITTLGIKRLGVVFWDEPSAHEALADIETQAKQRGAQVVLKAPVVAGTDQVQGAVDATVQTAPDALIVILPVNATAALVKGLRARNNTTLVYGPSYTESGMLVGMAGPVAARGVAVSQVVPNPFNGTIALVRGYQDAMKRYGPAGQAYGTYSLEGYIAAKLLVQAIARAGNTVTASSVRAALEHLHTIDLGGLEASLDPGNHVALSFLDIAVVSASGKLIY
jgi:ABC-type branched-subunit amino acid transport system substrate-binding protein